MLVHCRITPSIKFASTHLYTWVERGTVKVKCLAQEHNTMSPARAQTRNTHAGVECTNHEATAPPIIRYVITITKYFKGLKDTKFVLMLTFDLPRASQAINIASIEKKFKLHSWSYKRISKMILKFSLLHVIMCWILAGTQN